MKTKAYIDVEVHPNGPAEGDMAVYKGDEWVLLKGAYEDLDVSSNLATWDCETGLNKKINTDSNFQLTIENITNGMSGHVVISTTVAGVDITELDLHAPNYQITNTQGNGVLTNLKGVYSLCWVYDGSLFSYNIARYAD